jgi:hypothetical protein
MRTLLSLLLFMTAAPSFACVDRFFIDPPQVFVDDRAEVVVSGICVSTAAPYQPLVQVVGSTVTIDFAQDPAGLAVPVAWGERVRLPRLFSGVYDAVLRIKGNEVARFTFGVQDRPFRITPALARPGEKVLIEGLALDKPCPLVNCGITGRVIYVYFGDVEAETIEEIGDQQLLVTVPPGSGRVDVRVDLPSDESVVFPGAFRYGDGQEDSWERVLFPVHFFGAGAHGSFWRTRIAARNDGPVNMPVKPVFFPIPASGGVVGGGFEFIPAGARGFFEAQADDGGRFMFVPLDMEASLTYAAHIVDESRSTTDLGVEMPLVRAHDTTHTIRLLEVPVEERYRAKLRVYDYDSVNGRQVTVVFHDAEGELLGSRELTLTGVPVCVTTPCLPDRPAFNVLDLEQIEELREHDVVDVTVAAHTRETRIWAFVSVTNNETQAVTLYSPQHRTRAQ